MNAKRVVLDPRAIPDLYGRIEAMLGYEPGGAPDPVPATIREVIGSTADLFALEGGYVLCDRVEVTPEQITIDGVVFRPGKVVCGMLKNSRKAAVLLCTAGSGITEYCRRTKDDMLKSYVADVAGSVVVEAGVDRLCEEIAALGAKTTNRYSPGYCGWPVAEQQALFRLLSPGFCGVTLSESSLMHPLKSVSAVVGMGDQVRFNEYTCEICDVDHCLYAGKKKKR
jgi:hypothetical protein